ncbi:MAG: transposase [Deltaproteobacteria bacterium]|nr:transposase [Deltaproteobacteria bacterium]
MGLLLEYVVEVSHVITDGCKGYAPLELQAICIKYGETKKRKRRVTICPLVFSLFKHWILGTKQEAVLRGYSEYYLDEFVFMFNRRTSMNRILLFHWLIENAASVPSISEIVFPFQRRGWPFVYRPQNGLSRMLA